MTDGVELLRQRIHGNVQITSLRVSLDKFDVRVATPQVQKFGAGNRAAELAGNPERSPRGLFLDDYINRYNALAAISAGYVVTFSPPTPLGQTKSDGVVIGTPHSSWATEGMFCSDKGRAAIDIAVSSLANVEYRDCLQVGPILLRNGVVPTGLPSSAGTGSDFEKMVKGHVGHSVASRRFMIGGTIAHNRQHVV